MPNIPPISAAEAASQTGIPKRTLLCAIAAGKLKAHKLGGATGAYVIDQRELDRYMAKRDKAGAA